MKINEQNIITNGYFAYDGCHKIYVIEDENDLKEAKEYEYDILPIEALAMTYRRSCELRFISNWKLTKRYVDQFENDVYFGA